jgi:hypothetical protein
MKKNPEKEEKRMAKNDTGGMLKNRDAMSSFVMLLFAFWICYLSVRLSLWSEEGPGDGFFPFLGGILLFCFALCLFVQSWIRAGKINTVREPIFKTRLFTYVGSSLVYTFALNLIGFFLATFLLFFVICKVAEKISLKTSLIIACTSTIGFFIVFGYLLSLPFPPGFLKALTPW